MKLINLFLLPSLLLSMVSCDDSIVFNNGEPIQHETCNVLVDGPRSDSDAYLEEILADRGYNFTREESDGKPIVTIKTRDTHSCTNYGSGQWCYPYINYTVRFKGVPVFKNRLSYDNVAGIDYIDSLIEHITAKSAESPDCTIK